MNISEIAKKFDGREYGSEITKEEEAELKAAGMVVVFGYSDDNLEFRGAINDEFGCYEGGTALIDKNGLLEECPTDCWYYQAAKERATQIVGRWDCKGYSWYVAAPDLQPGFFDVLDDGEKYCRGIVFDLGAVR